MIARRASVAIAAITAAALLLPAMAQAQSDKQSEKQKYPIAFHHRDRAVPGRRAERRGRAHRHRRHVEASRPVDGDRECRRRRWHARLRPRRERRCPTAIRCLQAPWARMSRRPVLTPNVRYDSERDFIPIGVTADAPAVIVARKDFPANNLKEFVAYREGQWRQGEAGAWRRRLVVAYGVPAVQHRRRHQADASCAYRGTGPAMNDLIAGHVDFFCEQAVSVAEQVRGGTIKAFGVSATEPLRGAAECAGGEGRRRQFPDEHLGRHFRAQGHAEERGAQALGRARQGAGRSDRDQAAGRSRRLDSEEVGAQPGASSRRW